MFCCQFKEIVPSSKTIAIGLSFVGLLVGAGFATGQEVVQYFTSYGAGGIAGIIIAGATMALAGTVFLQLGSYYNASAHSDVFREVTHPLVSRFLDVCVIFTLFSIGLVMLAGAGSNLEQQFGLPTWVGAALMLGLVLVSGMLDVDKVSRVIGSITPLIIVAVVFMGVYTALNMPADWREAVAIAGEQPSPIGHWLVGALNYSGLALILAVSMCLVIGGDHINPREAGRGGLLGGIAYAILLFTAGFILMMNSANVADTDIPMLTLVNSINPYLGLAMAIIIYLMIFNTAVGMFYALGKRLTVNRTEWYRPVFIAVSLAGFGFSFVGFRELMASVYPILGYLGIVMVVVLVVAWLRSLSQIKDESVRRDRLRALLMLKLHPDKEYDEALDKVIGQHVVDSNVDNADLYEEIVGDVVSELDSDKAVDFAPDDYDADEDQVTAYTDLEGVEEGRSPEEMAAYIEQANAELETAKQKDSEHPQGKEENTEGERQAGASATK